MNISSESFPTDGSNSSDFFFYNGSENGFQLISLVYVVIFLLGFPINSYVIWLIITGTGNGLAAELFSLNQSICEMIFCLECLLNLISYKVENLWIILNFVDGLTLTGRPLFQSLICVERYLAVVHPVTFLKSKPLRYRLICCVIAWVATLVSGGIMFMTLYISLSGPYYVFHVAYFSLFVFIQLFCLVAVLRALKQSGPGDGRRERNENHTKKTAFYLILITIITMFIIYFPYTIFVSSSHLISNLDVFFHVIVCFTYVGFALAGSVQPLLFLYRVEKPPFVKCQ